MSLVRPETGVAISAVEQSGPAEPGQLWDRSRLTLRRLAHGSALHSSDFGMLRPISVLHLVAGERLVLGDGAVCSMSRLPSIGARRLAPVLLAWWIVVPGLALATLVGAPGSVAVRSAMFGLIGLMTFASIAKHVSGVVDGRRWGSIGAGSIVVSNVAVAERGQGRAARLLADVAAMADVAEQSLALAVDRRHSSACDLYRSLGFVDAPDVAVRRDRIAMIRPTQTSREVEAPPVGVALIAGWCVVGGYVLASDSLGSWPVRVAAVACLALLCIAARTDADIGRLPNHYLALAAVFVLAAAQLTGSWGTAFVGAAMGAAPFLLIHLVDPRALGFGDVKFALVAGSLLGIWSGPAALAMAIVALASACAVRVLHVKGPRAFGPSLFFATAASHAGVAAFTQTGVM